MTKAIIFDLDNCLAAATEVGVELFRPAFQAIREANHGDVSNQDMDRALSDIWRYPLDWVAAKYKFSDAMLEAAWRIFATLEVPHPMHGYGDLYVLADLPVQRFLVTSGFRLLQESKIRALQLAPLFASLHVDAIDEPGRLGKQRLFEQVLENHNLTPPEVLVVGDSAESEIAAGNRLGIPTVQTLRPGVPKADSATYHISSLAELRELLSNDSILPNARAITSGHPLP